MGLTLLVLLERVRLIHQHQGRHGRMPIASLLEAMAQAVQRRGFPCFEAVELRALSVQQNLLCVVARHHTQPNLAGAIEETRLAARCIEPERVVEANGVRAKSFDHLEVIAARCTPLDLIASLEQVLRGQAMPTTRRVCARFCAVGNASQRSLRWHSSQWSRS